MYCTIPLFGSAKILRRRDGRMTHMALTAVGTDRPGIVAALTGALYDLGCNIEDADSTVLRGVFAVTLVVAAPAGLDGPTLERAAASALGPIGASVSVRAIDDEPGPPAYATHRMRAHGTDRPGIVALLSRLLADRGVNMTSFSSHSSDDDEPVATLEAEVHVPPGVDVPVLAGDLIETATDLGLEVTFEHIERP
jgi:glycine cleavage system transcriptional repressor